MWNKQACGCLFILLPHTAFQVAFQVSRRGTFQSETWSASGSIWCNSIPQRVRQLHSFLYSMQFWGGYLCQCEATKGTWAFSKASSGAFFGKWGCVLLQGHDKVKGPQFLNKGPLPNLPAHLRQRHKVNTLTTTSSVFHSQNNFKYSDTHTHRARSLYLRCHHEYYKWRKSQKIVKVTICHTRVLQRLRHANRESDWTSFAMATPWRNYPLL